MSQLYQEEIQKVLVDSFKTGHAWNLKYPNLQNLDLDRVLNMIGTESDARDLVSSRQYSDINFDTLVNAWHQREARYDGDIGPATLKLVEMKRCPIPDFPPPEGANFDTGDGELNNVIESYQRFKKEYAKGAFAMGSGSWLSCDPERTGVNSFRVNLDLTRCPSKIWGYLDQALLHVREAYAEMGCAVRYIYDGDPKECEISKRFESLAGSVIGWNEFPNPNTCNQVISGRLDTGYTPDYKLWANLECHETGHGVGLDHTRGSIMNPSILLVWYDDYIPHLSWKNSPSESSLKRYFGGIPIPVEGVPPVLENPPILGAIYGEQIQNGEFVIRGTPVLDLSKNYQSGKYIYVCEPVPGQTRQYRFVQKVEV